MKLVCPCCLGPLKSAASCLSCDKCMGAYPIQDGVPVMLVRDENWTKKQDEIAGEIEFNTVTVAEDTHAKRNAFLNNNSLELLKISGTDLRGKSVLVVGSSMAEAECFSRLAGSMVGLDIVPHLTVQYRDACTLSALNVEWVCGDGECLPFASEVFDIVIVRQALHHMIRYYSAISEFFRVARVGGSVLIIEEPYSVPDMSHPAIAGMPDRFPLCHDITMGDLRRHLEGAPAKSRFRSLVDSISAIAGMSRAAIDFAKAEVVKDYIPATEGDAESLLADKYHRFSAVEMIVALRLQTNSFNLIWPENIGWARQEGAEILFESGPNSALTQPLIDRLSRPTTFSAVAKKKRPTLVARSRHGLLPVGEMA